MSPNVRAKFRVFSVTKEAGYSNTPGPEIVKLVPVYKAESAPENDIFWRSTPSGSIEMRIDNEKAHGIFRVGRSYYVDFTEAEG